MLNGFSVNAVFVGRLLLAIACMTVFPHGLAWAQFSGSSQSGTFTSVENVSRARSGDHVSLTGSLKRELRRAQYIFQDRTGEIRVRIESEFWRGRKVTSDSVLNIRGRVQSDVRGRFIDVYYFNIVE